MTPQGDRVTATGETVRPGDWVLLEDAWFLAVKKTSHGARGFTLGFGDASRPDLTASWDARFTIIRPRD